MGMTSFSIQEVSAMLCEVTDLPRPGKKSDRYDWVGILKHEKYGLFFHPKRTHQELQDLFKTCKRQWKNKNTTHDNPDLARQVREILAGSRTKFSNKFRTSHTMLSHGKSVLAKKKRRSVPFHENHW
jgi:hypothetical protein